MKITLKEWLAQNGYATDPDCRTRRRARLRRAGGAPSLLLALGLL